MPAPAPHNQLLHAPPRHGSITLISWLIILLLNGCASEQTHLIRVDPGSYPIFIDDASRESLIEAVDRQLDYLHRQSPEDAIAVGTQHFTNQALLDSLTRFRNVVLVSSSPLELSRAIHTYFRLYRASGRNGAGEVLVTGYYEPLFEGSLDREAPYLYPLYQLPESLITGTGNASFSVGRLDRNKRLVPFWTREEIDSDNLLGGDELVYLKDRLDVYLLQVQGSGRIMLPDGSSRSLHFAGSNGHQYNSLGKLFVDKSIMTREQVSIASIRAYFNDHPDELERMLFHNPRYIFFKWGDDQGPRGSLGQILTADRSVAIDHAVLPTGAVGYLVSRRPVLDGDGSINHWRTFGRFVLPQDSGSAIKGNGRVDLFFGRGLYAETAAGNMKEPGTLYFLLPRAAEKTARK